MMITKAQLRTVSLNFRRISSNLLNSEYSTIEVNLVRFLNLIEVTPFIKEIIKNAVVGVEFDYNDCFVRDSGGHGRVIIPYDERCHIKAQIDYANALVSESDDISISKDLWCFQHGISTDKVRDFAADAFKALIDYITDAISQEMIIMEENNRQQPMVMQHIEHNYGTANAQGSGSIHSQNGVGETSASLVEMIERLIPTLQNMEGIPAEMIDDVRDDLESAVEQVSSESPKKNRLQKAINGIRKFISECLMKAAVTCTVNGITTADWTVVADKLQEFQTLLLP